MKLLAPLTFCLLFTLVACGDGNGDESTVTVTGTTGATTSGAATPVGTVVFCSEETVNDVTDTWVTSITLLVEEKPELDLADEEGMRDDIETATRGFCEAGQSPPPEAVGVYCDGIVAAIDLRLDGPTADRDAFLTDYYNTCNATD